MPWPAAGPRSPPSTRRLDRRRNPRANSSSSTQTASAETKSSNSSLGLCKNKQAHFKQNVPHPCLRRSHRGRQVNLPSDGRGNGQTRLSQRRKRLDTFMNTALGAPDSGTAPLHEPEPEMPGRRPTLRHPISPMVAVSRCAQARGWGCWRTAKTMQLQFRSSEHLRHVTYSPDSTDTKMWPRPARVIIFVKAGLAA